MLRWCLIPDVVVALVLHLHLLFAHNITIFEHSQHHGARIDVVAILLDLSVKIILGGHRGDGSPHARWLKGKKNIIMPKRLTPFHSHQGGEIAEIDIKKLFDFYRHGDVAFRNVDAFVCASPVSFCEAYMPFNKTIIWSAVNRYSSGRCSQDSWQRLSDHITNSIFSSAQRPINFITASSQYDVEYINYFTGLNAMLLEPTAVLYLGGVRKHNPMRPEILLGPSQGIFLKNEDLSVLVAKAKQNGLVVAHPRTLYGKYRFDQLADHRAAIILPYAIQSHSTVEMYALGIPLFVPDIDFAIGLGLFDDRRAASHASCKGATAVEPPPKHPHSRHQHSPESDNTADVRYWLSFSDFYRWPHITHFSSWDDLFHKLKLKLGSREDLERTHILMVEESQQRLQRARRAWASILAQVERGRVMPSGDYYGAIQRLWNVSQLQVQ